MRVIDYTVIACKDLRRQFVRSSLTILALVISTVILVIMAAISIGGRQAITTQFGSDNAMTTLVVTPNQSNGTLNPFGTVQEVHTQAGKLDDSTVTRLASLPHVQLVTPRAHIWEFNSLALTGSTKQFVASAEGIADDAQLKLKAGSPFGPDDNKHEVILGSAYAKEMGYENTPQALIGQTVEITTQKGYRGTDADLPNATASQQAVDAFNHTETNLRATIIGITDTGPDQSELFIPLRLAHAVRTARYKQMDGNIKAVDQLTNDGYTSIQLKTDTTSNVKLVTASVSKLGYGVVSTLSQVERLQQFSMTMWILLGAVATIAIVASALGVVNTMLMAVSEQRYAIGIWRASGARRGFIVTLFLFEAALLGLIGGVLGDGLGVLAGQFVNQYVNSLLKAQGLNLTDIAIIPFWLLTGTIALTTIFGVIAGLYPAYRAARQDPSRILSSGQ